jgi:RND family efflux transporter MFP subunit
MRPDQQQPAQQATPERTGKAALLRLLLPALVIIGAALVAVWLIRTGPQAKPRPKARSAVLVTVRPVEFGSHAVTASAMGTVIPQRQVILSPQVSGQVIQLSDMLVPGGRLSKGDPLLTIDPSDYQLAVQQLAGEVARVEADRQIELGRQRVARKEYELLGEAVSDEEQALMLREPQLANIRAVLDATEARLEQARLDLDRTVVKAPFNAVVISRQVDLGTSVAPGATLATLVGSDSFWIEAPVSANQLKWISIGRANRADGSTVHVFDTTAWGPETFRTGRVVSLAALVEEQGRMARLIIEVPDPMALRPETKGQPSLLLGSYVRVDILGTTLPRAARIERDLVHDGNRVWVMDDQGNLDIRAVEVAYRGQDYVLVTGGLQPAERLVTSNLPAPVQGMSLGLRDGSSDHRSEGELDKP